jgi:hypothetical protein
MKWIAGNKDLTDRATVLNKIFTELKKVHEPDSGYDYSPPFQLILAHAN